MTLTGKMEKAVFAALGASFGVVLAIIVIRLTDSMPPDVGIVVSRAVFALACSALSVLLVMRFKSRGRGRDIDGVARPTTDPSPDYAGADIP